MKKIILPALIGLFLLAPLACKGTFDGPSSPVPPAPSPTSTPEASATPVCGFSLINLGTVALDAGPSVIRSLADWQAYCSYPTGMISLTPVPAPPVPPVDFSTQMLILMITPVCAASTLQVTGVCEGPDRITVWANNVHACAICNVAASWGYASALVVPQSSLPIAWDVTQVPCQWGSFATPVPTATP